MLVRVFPPIVVQQIILSICVIAVPAGVLYLQKSFKPAADPTALLRGGSSLSRRCHDPGISSHGIDSGSAVSASSGGANPPHPTGGASGIGWTSVRPGDDFWAYASQTFVRAHPIPAMASTALVARVPARL